MAASYLLDTNICIYIHRNRPPEVAAYFGRLALGDAVQSIITYGELLVGAHKSQRCADALQTLAEFAGIVPVVSLPLRAASVYGELRASLESKGKVIGGNDLWIAAHALAAGLTLVTNNEREFKRIPGLKVQNWVK